MSMQLTPFVVGKFVGACRRLQMAQARTVTRREHPQLLDAYSEFSNAHQVSSARQPFKGWDVWRLLDQYRPRFIAEMGSGTTSAVFALWAKRNQARYIAYESHPEWARVTENCLRKAGLIVGQDVPLRVVGTRISADGQAVGFVEAIPTEADFVYIDGPPCVLQDGRKVPNDDIVRLFDSNTVPRTIVLDGRLETVDLIKNHRAGRRYDCAPAYSYCRRHGLWSAALNGREHTIFSLK